MYKLVYSREFTHDLERIRDYTEKDSPIHAVNTVQSIFKSIEWLKTYPKIGTDFCGEYRQLVESKFKYKILYKLVDNKHIELSSVNKYN